ncbi:MAG: type I methionyl aminopeptidase [Patescibacteria group bacterium]
MSTIIKTEEDIKIVREGGRRLAFVLSEVLKAVKPGITTKELDVLAEKLIRGNGDIPAFLNYKPDGADRPYPATLCVSVNNEVVHGIPGARTLKEGDIVGLDLGLKHGGFFVDAAITAPVGKIDAGAHELIRTTKQALQAGIGVIKNGGRIGDISEAIEKEAIGGKYGVVQILGGHGIGKHIHEEPHIANYGESGTGPMLKKGMLLALEPIFNEGGGEVYIDHKDGYTFRTLDGSRSAHFEHTVLVTEKGAEILTILPRRT